MGLDPMGDGLEQLMKTWVPILGAGLSIGLGTVPMQEVLRCRRNKSLGKVRLAPSVFCVIIKDM